MRLAVVSPYSVSVPGGVQGQVAGLAAVLARRGHDVEVLAPGDDRSPVRKGESYRTTVVGRSLAVPVNGSRAPVSPWPSTMARTVRLLRRGGYDVVHVHEPLAPGPPLAAMLSGAGPLVGTFHRSGTDAAYRTLGLLARSLRKRLAVAVAVSEQARLTAVEVLGSRSGEIEVLWNGVDVHRFRRARPSASDVPAVVFVGRHERRKGLDTLIEAFKGIDADLALWVCGEGPETATLKAASAGDDRIAWLGRVSDEEVASRLAGSTVACFPARGGESFGLVLAEAMAAGTAVVASDVPGYRAALGEAGVVVPAEDVAGWREAIVSLLASSARRAALVEVGRRRAVELSLDGLADRYEEIYSRLVTRP